MTYLEKTLTYLNSERGIENWARNKTRGFTYEQNLVAAIQTATRLIKYERIIEVMNELKEQRKAA